MSSDSSTANREIYELISTPAVTVDKKPMYNGVCGSNGKLLGFLVTFLIVFAIAWFFLYNARPHWVETVDSLGVRRVDNTKVALWSLVFALLACAILWAAQMCM
jgi:hypothetical protein